MFLWGELKEQTDKLVADCSFYQKVEMFLTVYQSIRFLQQTVTVVMWRKTGPSRNTPIRLTASNPA